MLIVGLTGSIGMGKTTTCGMFRAAGVPVHDSDAAVHELYASLAVAPISTEFPGVVENGVINRATLGKIVLRDNSALKRLEEIVHPLVMLHRANFLNTLRKEGHALCVVDIPLLFETSLDQQVNINLVVTASAPVQKRRVMARPAMTEEKFDAILSRQLPDLEKRRKAHWIIDSSYGLDSARRQVLSFLRSASR